MKKLKSILIIGVICAALIWGGLVGLPYIMEGTAPVITYGDTEIKVGSAYLDEFFEAGFDSSEAKLAGGYWDKYSLYSDDEYYGQAFISNSASDSKEKGRCKVFGILVNYTEKAQGDVLVNEIDFRGCTMDEIKVLMEDYKILSESENILTFDAKKYDYKFEFEDGVVTRLTVTDDTRNIG